MDERDVVVVGYPLAQLLDIACVTDTLDLANQYQARPGYRVRVVSPGGHPISCQSGMTLQAHAAIESCRGPLDTLVISGGWGHQRAAESPQLIAHVRRLAHVSRRVTSVCTGTTLLAAAGLLNGKRATTHWQFADGLAHAYPEVTVDPRPIYIRDGDVTTAAGVTSALDLTLALVAEDHGSELARSVARSLVTYLQRPGNQAQMSMFIEAPPPDLPLVRQLVDHVTSNLGGDLSTSELARHAGVSERHLNRLFTEHVGQTPGRYVRHARTEAAAHLLTSTGLPASGVAARCGFASAEALRQAFVARYGVSPSRYRTSFAEQHGSRAT